MIDKVNLEQKFSLINTYWEPKLVGELNDQYVKLAKLKGEFVWHHHENEDEMFLVIEGWMTMRLRDGDVRVGPGEFIIIPQGVEHKPVAVEEVHVMLFEPKATLNTGNVESSLTKTTLEEI